MFILSPLLLGIFHGLSRLYGLFLKLILSLSVQVGGKTIPGPLFDFGLHMFHNGRLMLESGSGPFFYLPKVQ